MNTLEDLRATLHGHAGEVEHRPDAARAAAVHQRVAVVRRQRRAAVAGAVAAVLAVVGGVVLLPRAQGPDPAGERRLAGHTAPATLESLGFGYAFERGVEGEGAVTVELASTDEPRLVSWAGPAGVELTLRALGQRRTVSGAFDDFTLVPEGAEGRITVRGDGDVGLAVYTLSSLPDGVVSEDTAPTTVFRDEVAGQPLLAAGFGTGSLTLDLVTPRKIRLVKQCRGVPSRTSLRVLLDGRNLSIGACEDWRIDAGAGSSVTVEVPAGRHSLTTQFVAVEGWEPATPPKGGVGVGVYDATQATRSEDGFELPTVVEADGHSCPLWSIATSAGPTPWSDQAPPGGESYVVLHVRGAAEGSSFGVTGGGLTASWISGSRLASSTGLGIVAPDTVLTVRGRGPSSSRQRVLLAYYERAD